METNCRSCQDIILAFERTQAKVKRIFCRS